MSKKWQDPLDKLLAADKQASAVSEYIKKAKKVNSDSIKEQSEQYGQRKGAKTTPQSTTIIQEIDTDKIHRWSGKDRPENELEGVESLLNSFKQVGQQVPCILRKLKNHKDEYELIAGECRWLAAKKLNIPLKAVVYELDDRMAALVQAVENEQRSDISDYAKGISYTKKIKGGILSQKDLVDVLGISKQQVTRLLSFSKIPPALSKAIGDFRQVSARTAYELSRIGNKDEEKLQILISLADRIRNGKIGSDSIIKAVDKKSKIKNTKQKKAQKVTSSNGRHLFTWRLDNNNTKSIHLPKSIERNINYNELTDEIKKAILKCLEKFE